MSGLRVMVDALKGELNALESSDARAPQLRPTPSSVQSTTMPEPWTLIKEGGDDSKNAEIEPSAVYAEDESISIFSQETYTGHESAVNFCKFSSENTLVGSVDSDNILRFASKFFPRKRWLTRP